jgi:hypothetical protein
LPGAGMFSYDEELILSRKGTFKDEKGIKKPYTRTNWKLPDAFLGASVKLLNGSQPIQSTMIKAASRGQEFVVLKDPNGKVSNWAEEFIKKHVKK